ncbi:MAG: hypothetical protein II258_08735, partial [Spirochaetales bacterium]|nr:hypothetical protein [Spirochaetales bacterium]
GTEYSYTQILINKSFYFGYSHKNITLVQSFSNHSGFKSNSPDKPAFENRFEFKPILTIYC